MGHLALHRDHEFAPQLLASGEQFGAAVRLEHHLRDAVAVAQVHEHEDPVIAVGVDPAVQDDGLPDVRFAQLAAGVGSPQPGHFFASASHLFASRRTLCKTRGSAQGFGAR